MGEERQRTQAFQACHHIRHFQLAAVMKADRRADVKAPVQRRKRLPVMGDIRLDFPIFLIYARQTVKNLAGKMRFRTAQRRAGKQIQQRPVVKHAQNMFALSETAAEMRADHLTYFRLVAHQLHQLIDAILLQQIFSALLLKRESGVAKGEL